jgi:hypothetical protein
MVRAFQSDEDRRIPAIERTLKSQGEQLETYYQRREAGQTHEQALREQALDELVAGKLGDAPVPPEQEAAPQAKVAVTDNLSPILKLTGLDSNDADVVEIIRANPNNELAQINAVTQLAESRKQAQQTPANAAATLPSGGGSALEPNELETITKELNEVLALPSTPENRQRIQELGKKQREFIPKE